jgi:hypothetical protein
MSRLATEQDADWFLQAEITALWVVNSRIFQWAASCSARMLNRVDCMQVQPCRQCSSDRQAALMQLALVQHFSECCARLCCTAWHAHRLQQHWMAPLSRLLK